MAERPSPTAVEGFAEAIVSEVAALRAYHEEAGDVARVVAARERVEVAEALGDRMRGLATVLGDPPLFEYAPLPELVVRIWGRTHPPGPYLDPWGVMGSPAPERLRVLALDTKRPPITFGARTQDGLARMLTVADDGRLLVFDGRWRSGDWLGSVPTGVGTHVLPDDRRALSSGDAPVITFRRHWWLQRNHLRPFDASRWLFGDQEDPAAVLAGATCALARVVEAARDDYRARVEGSIETLETRTRRVGRAAGGSFG